MTQELMSIGQAIRELGIDRVTAYRWEKRGVLKPKKDNKGYRFFDKSEIERIKQEREPK